jgi:hypothetical protein
MMMIMGSPIEDLLSPHSLIGAIALCWCMCRWSSMFIGLRRERVRCDWRAHLAAGRPERSA